MNCTICHRHCVACINMIHKDGMSTTSRACMQVMSVHQLMLQCETFALVMSQRQRNSREIPFSVLEWIG